MDKKVISINLSKIPDVYSGFVRETIERIIINDYHYQSISDIVELLSPDYLFFDERLSILGNKISWKLRIPAICSLTPEIYVSFQFVLMRIIRMDDLMKEIYDFLKELGFVTWKLTRIVFIGLAISLLNLSQAEVLRRATTAITDRDIWRCGVH